MKQKGAVPTWALIIGVLCMVAILALYYGETVFSVGLAQPTFFTSTVGN